MAMADIELFTNVIDVPLRPRAGSGSTRFIVIVESSSWTTSGRRVNISFRP